MSPISSIAVVLDGGLVQTVIVQDWPTTLPLPRIVVVDYDTDGADEDELTQFSIADTPTEAVCYQEPVSVYESFDKALSPNLVLAALGESIDQAPSESPLAIARRIRQSILDFDEQLERLEQPPTCDDYSHLYQLANGGLIDLLKALGDTTDFGD